MISQLVIIKKMITLKQYHYAIFMILGANSLLNIKIGKIYKI